MRTAGNSSGVYICKSIVNYVRHGNYIQGFDAPFSSKGQLTLCTVFSASNYGGTNDGAYMQFTSSTLANEQSIIVEGTKLSFNVFKYNITTSPNTFLLKPENKEESLSDLILKKKQVLRRAFEAADIENDGWISVETWVTIMSAVTKLKIRWVVMTQTLIPSDGIRLSDGIDEVNFNVFLSSVVKTNLVLDRHEENSTLLDPENTVEAIYGKHRKLDTVFQYFDKACTGYITKESFHIGCELLNKSLPFGYSISNDELIFDLLDIIEDRRISLNEFFEIFRIIDQKYSKSAISRSSSRLMNTPSSPSEEALRLRDIGISIHCDSEREHFSVSLYVTLFV